MKDIIYMKAASKYEVIGRTDLVSQIQYIQNVNSLIKTPVTIAIENSLKELKSIKNKTCVTDKFDDLKQFLYSEITERRDYSASKMCEVILSKIDELQPVSTK